MLILLGSQLKCGTHFKHVPSLYFQVTEETCGILRPFGYQFEQRGLVSVKGKGQLMTYYLIGKGQPPAADTLAVSTDQISASIDDDASCTLNSAISGNSATQLLASSVE